jgi:cytochrome P450
MDPMTHRRLSEDLRSVNLADPLSFSRPDLHDIWRRFRREAPVYLHPETEKGPSFWVLSRYADVRSLYQDHRRFSSKPGNMLPSLHKPGGDPAAGIALALTDAPRHHAMRSALLKAFGPRSRDLIVNRLQPRVDRLIERVTGAGPVDFAKEVAEKISMGTICDLLGFPAADHDRLLTLSRQALSSDEVDQTDEQAWVARNELLLHCQDLVEARRSHPADDLVSAMVGCLVDGEPMTNEHLVVNCYGFILAGDQTSRLAMVDSLVAFRDFPQEWEALKQGHRDIGSAVEEVVRWASPVMHVARTVVEDVDVGGHTLRAGDTVTGWNTSANRDDAAFEKPDTFNLGRTPNQHLGFGHGAHFCFGAFLGRAEIGALLSTLVRRVDDLYVHSDQPGVYSTFLHGYSSLTVELS